MSISRYSGPLYKYTSSKYVEDFVNNGVVQIGTLYDYRRTEYGPEIGDAAEGTKMVHYTNPTGITYLDTKNGVPGFLQDRIVGDVAGLRIMCHGINRTYSDSDRYIFSMSSDFDRDAMLQCGYDACVVIVDADRFFERVTRAMGRPVRFLGCFKCEYENRRIPHDHPYWDISPSLIKDKKYTYQSEVRAIWTAEPDDTLSPFRPECGSLSNYCYEKSNSLVGAHTSDEESFDQQFLDIVAKKLGYMPNDAELSKRASLGIHKTADGFMLHRAWDGEGILATSVHQVENGARFVSSWKLDR